MHKKFMTYFTWLGDELITVPNFPGWVCDVCGKRDYDLQAVSWLNMLLNPTAGKKTPHRKLPQTKPLNKRPQAHTDKTI